MCLFGRLGNGQFDELVRHLNRYSLEEGGHTALRASKKLFEQNDCVTEWIEVDVGDRAMLTEVVFYFSGQTSDLKKRMSFRILMRGFEDEFFLTYHMFGGITSPMEVLEGDGAFYKFVFFASSR